MRQAYLLTVYHKLPYLCNNYKIRYVEVCPCPEDEPGDMPSTIAIAEVNPSRVGQIRQCHLAFLTAIYAILLSHAHVLAFDHSIFSSYWRW